MAGTLTLVPTPIGNLGDLSPRAIEALRAADFIAAEDTRVTLKLLNHFGIKKSMMPYYRHNVQAGGEAILRRLLAGESCALVTDAGTPAVSDPGEELVKLCVDSGVTVSALPGPCALTTALSVSGLPTGRFTFEGFLPMNKKNRKAHLDSLLQEPRTMLFYEAPHKLASTLSDLSAAFGPERPIALCRELTKLHEEVIRTTLGEAAQRYAQEPPRGEFVLVVGGAPEAPAEAPKDTDALELVQTLMSQGLSRKDAIKEASQVLGIPKNQLYALALQEGRKGE